MISAQCAGIGRARILCTGSRDIFADDIVMRHSKITVITPRMVPVAPIRLIQIRIIGQQLRTVVPGLKLTGQAALGVKNLLDRFPFVVFIELVQPEIIMRSTICIVPREGNFLVLGIGLLHILKLRLARTARIAGIKQSRFIRVPLYFAADRAFIALIMRVGRLVIRKLIHVAGVFLRRC